MRVGRVVEMVDLFVAARSGHSMSQSVFTSLFFPLSIGMPAKREPHSANQIRPSPKGRGGNSQVGPLDMFSASHWPDANSCLGGERKLCN